MVDNVVTKMRDFHLEVVMEWKRVDTVRIKSEVSRSFKIMEKWKDVLSTRREQAYLSNHHKVLRFQGVGAERCGNGWTAVVWQNHSGEV
jgi:hypothetical protein